jgi:hypothetical protein
VGKWGSSIVSYARDSILESLHVKEISLDPHILSLIGILTVKHEIVFTLNTYIIQLSNSLNVMGAAVRANGHMVSL